MMDRFDAGRSSAILFHVSSAEIWKHSVSAQLGFFIL